MTVIAAGAARAATPAMSGRFLGLRPLLRKDATEWIRGRRAWIVAVGAGDCRKHQSAILSRPAHRAYLVQGPGERIQEHPACFHVGAPGVVNQVLSPFIRADDNRERQVVAQPHLIIIRIMSGSNFHTAGPELRIDQLVGDDRNLFVAQR